jgi:soluble lytic murein transglycosylase-like protein
MRHLVMPISACVALVTALGQPALARERSHHHRHAWASKHSVHHSLRSYAYSRHGQRWRHRRVVRQVDPYPVSGSVPAPRFAWQAPTPQPVLQPYTYSRHGQRRHRGYARLAGPHFVSAPFAPPFGWQTPASQPFASPFTWQPPASAYSHGVQRRLGAAARQGIPSHFGSLVSTHAQANRIPESLVHRVIMRESRYNPRAVSRGNYGIMQIRLGTARAMGYTGSAAGLLDPHTNMTYAVRYLAGAYRAAGGNPNRAVSLYASGYYYHAKRQGFSPYAMASASGSPYPTMSSP